MAEDEHYDAASDRLRVLEAVYDVVRDDVRSTVRMRALRDQLGMSDLRCGNATDYLAGERLLKVSNTMGPHTPLYVQITHAGVKAMEASKNRPLVAARPYLPPYNVVHVYGSVVGSAIQVGSPGSTQTVQIGDVTIDGKAKETVNAFVETVEEQMPRLREELGLEQAEQVAAEIATVKAQIASPKPKRHFIEESLHSVRAILEAGVGGAATIGLLDAITRIHV